MRTSVDLSGAVPGSLAGLAVIGGDRSHFVALRRTAEGSDCILGTPEGVTSLHPCPTMKTELAVRVDPDGTFRFTAPEVPAVFAASQGGWIGAKVGLFHMQEQPASPSHADFGPFVFSS